MLSYKPLKDLRVLVTRAGGQAKELSSALVELGAQPVELPLIKVVPPKRYAPLDEAIEKLPQGYDWLIFTSANAVRFFAERLKALGKGPDVVAGVKIASIGPATSQSAYEQGFNTVYKPKKAVAESVVEGFAEIGVEGRRFLLPRAEIAREIIPDRLREMGAVVDVVDAYRTVLNEESRQELRRLVEGREIDVVTFTSSSTVKNFVELIGGERLRRLEGVLIAVIGPVTAKTAERFGLKVDVVPDEFTVRGMVKALADFIGKQK